MTDTTHDRQFSTSAPASWAGEDGAPAVAWLARRPVVVACAGIMALSGIGWIVLGLIAAGVEGGTLAAALRDHLCWPQFGGNAPWGAASIAAEFGFVAAMWSAMVLAMMLPTAGPMIVTYAEIADTAARKGETVVSPLILTAGYTAVWLGFALALAVLQIALMRAALLDPAFGAASPFLAGGILVAAGLYQFSTLKYACIRRCRRPFPFFFAHWTDETAGVFRLGLRQGIYCLGCCWAMMLATFAIGAMNVAWMAALGLAMGVEKIAPGRSLPRVLGGVLITAGVVYLVMGSSL